jgi:transcriptional regulator with XRE-family HTH domain
MAKKQESVMDRVRSLFAKSEMSQHELGLKMGYPAESARKSVWQFLKTDDPRLSMLERFAEAMGISVSELLG